MKNKVETLRTFYLYLLSLTGALMLIFGIGSLSNSLIDIYVNPNRYINAYEYQSIARDIVLVIIGIIILIYHWRILRIEKRIGHSENNVENTNMNFWEALFFYSLSFVGILLLSFSLASVAGGFFDVEYPANYNPIKGQNEIQYLKTNIAIIIQNAIRAVIGLIVWLLSWGRIQKAQQRKDIKETKGDES
jgi:hypothetical protein